uniref:Uncharacterized protein n=1 Tax=Arundo donax TaxID=35708 RepID=A0A0A9FNR8_ARUDO
MINSNICLTVPNADILISLFRKMWRLDNDHNMLSNHTQKVDTVHESVLQ